MFIGSAVIPSGALVDADIVNARTPIQAEAPAMALTVKAADVKRARRTGVSIYRN
jgi:hypothetical protein